MDRWTNGRTDKASFRVARPRLKKRKEKRKRERILFLVLKIVWEEDGHESEIDVNFLIKYGGGFKKDPTTTMTTKTTTMKMTVALRMKDMLNRLAFFAR